MGDGRDTITRREALARLGGAALGSALAPTFLSAQDASTQARKSTSGGNPAIPCVGDTGVCVMD